MHSCATFIGQFGQSRGRARSDNSDYAASNCSKYTAISWRTFIVPAAGLIKICAGVSVAGPEFGQVGIGRAASTGERHKAQRGNRLDFVKKIWGQYSTVNNHGEGGNRVARD